MLGVILREIFLNTNIRQKYECASMTRFDLLLPLLQNSLSVLRVWFAHPEKKQTHGEKTDTQKLV